MTTYSRTSVLEYIFKLKIMVMPKQPTLPLERRLPSGDGKTPQVYKAFGRMWQLNMLADKLRKLEIVHAFVDSDKENIGKILFMQPITEQELVSLVTLANSKEMGGIAISRIDFQIQDRNETKVLVFNKEITEECFKYAQDNNLTNENFIETSPGCTIISKHLFNLVGYEC